MVTRFLALLAVVGLDISLACAEPAKPAPARVDPAAVDRLVAQLGSERFEERETACKELDALGPAALDALRAALLSRNEETRRRAIDLVARIQLRVETERLTRPRMVRLAYNNVPVNQAVQDMARKTGFPIQLEGDQNKFANRKITLDTGDIPFWQAVDLFCAKAGLVERGSVGLSENPPSRVVGANDVMFLSEVSFGPRPPMPLVFLDGKPQALLTHYAGAMRVRILPRAARNAAAPQDGTPLNPSSSGTLLTFEVSPEPTLEMQNLLSVRVDKVLDDKGNELKAPLPYISEPVSSGMEQWRWARGWANGGDTERLDQDLSKRVPIRMHVPDGVKKLKEIRGFVAAEVRTPHQPLITVENLLNAANNTVVGADGSSLKILDLTRDDKGKVVVRVVVEKPAPRENAFGDFVGMVAFPGGGGIVGGGPAPSEASPDAAVKAIAEILSLMDEKNQAFKLIAAEDQVHDNQTNEYRLTFQPPSGAPKPAKLVYSGRRNTTIDVPFVLKDVPLP
jgi:hypothetical protein